MKFTCLGGALLLPLLTTGCVVALDSQSQIVREEKRFTVSGTVELRVATFDGAIEIQSWDRPDVVVAIEKRGPTREAIDALEIRTEQHGNAIELEVKKPHFESFADLGFGRSATARLTVSVPRRADLRASSGDGSIRIDRVNGRIELHTGDGSIRANDVSGDLTFNTGDGSITVDGAEGRLALDTGDGGVNVAGKLTSLRLHSGDGSIVYRAEPGSVMSDDWEITTGDGGVSLYLPEQFDADVDAHTGDGTIHSDLAIDAAGGEVGRRTIRGRMGNGGKRLRIRTGDGSIGLHVR